MAELANRVVIVTGASAGIGRAAAVEFARRGADVLAVARRREALDVLSREVPKIAGLPADIRASETPDRVIAEAERLWGRVDVLVNNAGATEGMPLHEATAERVARLFSLNVTAPSLLARAVLPWLARSQGSIINVSSTYGHRPMPVAAHYAASKAALEQLTRSWALELAGEGIRVNAVAPGPTESEALVAAGFSAEMVDTIKRQEAERIPLGRRGEPAEVAEWIVRLADPTASWLTGQVLTIDGGLELT